MFEEVTTRTKTATTKRPTHKHTNALMKRGYQVVVGIDEVGRGALAGPVTAAAVILPSGIRLTGVNDSKLVTRSERERLAIIIKRKAVAIGIGWTPSAQIDERGLTWAVRQAAQSALVGMRVSYDAVLLDGHHNYLGGHCVVETVIKGDSLCLNIAAASIVAKVARDNYMRLQHRLYPEYGFDRHVGYGTPEHLLALQGGLTPIHRRRFAPIAKLADANYSLSPSKVQGSDFLEFVQIGQEEYFDVD